MSDKHLGVGRVEMVPQSGLQAPLSINQTGHTDSRTTLVGQSGRPITGGIVTTSSISGVVSPRKRKLTVAEITQLRRKVSENESVRILRTASRYAERCAVRCYLGESGSPAEYPGWRNRLPHVPLISTLVANRLDDEDPYEDLFSLLRRNTITLLRTSSNSQETISTSTNTTTHAGRVVVSSPTSTGNPAASTTAPYDKITSRPSIRLPVSPYKSSLSPVKHETSGDVSPSNQEHIVERAKQEAYVMQRVAELQRDGLWSEKRVPKVQELPRPKSHWDYLLEEMVWLAADFAQERMWKKAAAKRCATMVQRYFREKELAIQRESLEREAEKRHIATVMATEVKRFWSDADKLVRFKKRTMEDESHKHCLNHHLSIFSETAPSIEVNEKLEDRTVGIRFDNSNEEVQTLKRESRVPVEDLIGDYLEIRDTLPMSPSAVTESSDDLVPPNSNLLDLDDNKADKMEEDILLNTFSNSSSSSAESLDETSSSDELSESESAVIDCEDVLSVSSFMKTAECLQYKSEALFPNENIKVPFLLRKKMRGYQQSGFNWLVSLYEKSLNGVLADESGLGKTGQVIAMLAHLACEKGVWGPHLVVVPTSDLLSWEDQFKRWCPGLKVLSYYGSVRERKSKRSGWSRPNSFHICITTYKLVLEDMMSFRRKKWKYLILDEAQMIGDIDSIRWLPLKNIRTVRKLILIGKPLNKNQVRSFTEFLLPDNLKSAQNEERFDHERLYKLLCLGRVWSRVEDQMPRKLEHVVKCRLTNRQRHLYDDFMGKKETEVKLRSGNLLDILNVVLSLKKICDHPDLFQNRSVISPLVIPCLKYRVPSLVTTALDLDPLNTIDILSLDFNLLGFEITLSAFVAHRSRRFKTPKKLIEEIDMTSEPHQCPRKLGGIKISVKKTNSNLPGTNLKASVRPALLQIGSTASNQKVSPTKIGTSPIVKAAVIQPNTVSQGVTLRLANPIGQIQNYLQIVGQQGKVTQTARLAHIVNTPAGKQILISPHQLLSSQPSTVVTSSGQRLTVVSKQGVSPAALRPLLRLPPLAVSSNPNILIGTANTETSSDTTVVPPPPSLFETPKVNHDSKPLKTTQDILSKSDCAPNGEKINRKQASFTTDGNNLVDNVDKIKEKLNLVYRMNEIRCSRLPVYGTDVIARLTVTDDVEHTDWRWTGAALCKNSILGDDVDSTYLSRSIVSIEKRLSDLNENLRIYITNVSKVNTSNVKIEVTKGALWKNEQRKSIESFMEKSLCATRKLLQPVTSLMQTQFPEQRLLKNDCGKLQTLDLLLKLLQKTHHKPVIFTHMTRMLDILESFMKYHGYSFLRLDSLAKMDQRRMLVDRFNNDRHIFCLIMSSRSGYVGIDLTEPDCVILYDHDWNPTMESCVQKCCDRLCQNRDVNIYKFLTENTVEENFSNRYIQKRLLNDLLVEGECITEAYLKTSTIQDLLDIDISETGVKIKSASIHRLNSQSSESSVEEWEKKKHANSVLERALAEIEDPIDVASAKLVENEIDVRSAEFDEEIQPEFNSLIETPISKAELEIEALEQELNGIERFAVKFVEDNDLLDEENSAEENWERVKRGWETNRSLDEREELKRKRKDSLSDDEELTYSGVDARCPDWVTKFGLSMPIWAPPTPPQDDNDMYIDEALCLLYEPTLIPESQLPPAYTKKDRKRSRMELNLINSRLQSNKVRQKDETLVHAPRSLFDRPTPTLVKMRQELRLQRYRGLMRPAVQNILKPPLPVKPLPEPDHVPDWLIHEDWTILQAVQQVQEMTVNLVVLSPGHTPNWDLVADMVNMSSRTYRSPKQCRNRYESVIIPREEGKSVPDSPKKQKKNKLLYKPPQLKSGRPMRTSHLFQQDNNSSMTQVMNCRFDAIRAVSNRRAPTVKPLLVDPTMKNNPRHADTLARSQIDYDRPLTPVEVAAKRADRIAREKLINSAPIQVSGISDQTQLAVLRQQQLQKLTAPSSSTASPRQLATLTVQEMVATVGGNRTVVSSAGLPVSRAVNAEVKAGSSAPSPSGSGASSSPTSPSTTATPLANKTATKTISATQLAIYRQQQHQQALMRQQHLKLLKSQQAGGAGSGTAGSSTPPKVSIAVTPPQSPAATGTVTTVPRMPQVVVKSGRTVTESEVVALLKRQQAAKVQGVGGQSAATLTTAQILTSIHVKALNAASAQGDATAVLPQQVKPITLPHQLLAAAAAHQQRTGKITAGQQKVAQFAQVPTKGGAGGTQLIVQSGHKTLSSTTVTVQQIQQVMKQVRPGHVVVAGPARSGTIPGTVSLEGRQVLAGALKTSQQAILTQVSSVTTAGRTTTPLVSAPLITIPPTASPNQSSTDPPSQHH